MKLILLLFFSSCLFSHHIAAQQADTSISKIYFYLEQTPQPSFDVRRYLQDNLRYPPTARAMNIQGKVVVGFTVDPTGQLDSVIIKKSVSPDLGAEAVRVVKNMRRWKPGLQNGKAVRVNFSLPISFRLEGVPMVIEPIDSLERLNNLRIKDSLTKNYAPEPDFDWYNYISKRIHKPRNAELRDKLVQVRFEVAADGQVTNVAIEQFDDQRLNEETLKLAKRMALRRWRPGKRKGVWAEYHCVLPFYYPK